MYYKIQIWTFNIQWKSLTNSSYEWETLVGIWESKMSPNNKSLRADNSDVVAYPLTPKLDIQKQLGSLRKENYLIDQLELTKGTGQTRLKNLVRVATEKSYEYCGLVVTTNYR